MAPTWVKCPTCQRELDWDSTASRPFCSERCRLIDLGAWLTERHTIPGEPDSAESADVAGQSAPPIQH